MLPVVSPWYSGIPCPCAAWSPSTPLLLLAPYGRQQLFKFKHHVAVSSSCALSPHRSAAVLAVQCTYSSSSEGRPVKKSVYLYLKHLVGIVAEFTPHGIMYHFQKLPYYKKNSGKILPNISKREQYFDFTEIYCSVALPGKYLLWRQFPASQTPTDTQFIIGQNTARKPHA